MNRIKDRYSSIELLRIICMVMIVMHHIIIVEFYSVPEILEGKGNVDTMMSVGILLNFFCYIAVNCFILISGYYGIKFKWRKLFHLYVMCSFYVFIVYITGGMNFTDFVRRCLGPFSSRCWWFMTEFVVLYLLSPFLNIGVNCLKKKEFQIVLILFTIANIYLGFLFDQFSGNGYCVAHFVYLYLVASYMKKYTTIQRIGKKKSLGLYVVCSLVLGILAICTHYIDIPRYRSYAYNNPILIIASISFFITFLNIHFKSKIVNWLAYSSLAIYLMPNFYRKEFCHNLFVNIVDSSSTLYGIICMLLIAFFYAVFFCLFAMLMDKVRVLTIERWSMKAYDGVVSLINKYRKR